MELLSELDLGESIIAAPVPVDNHLIVRAGKKLYCFTADKS